ncbi:MAG: hypothetical protein N2C12_13145, partial [Planctomycetales bacterium]
MKRQRFIAITVALLMIGAVCAGAAWQLSGLPDPATADRRGLMQWMVTRDLASEPVEIRSVLVKRLEEELRVGVDLDQVDGQVDRQQSEQFWSNVDVLLADWFAREADWYAELKPVDRIGQLKLRIDDVLGWQYVQQLREEYKNGVRSGGEFGLLKQCEDRTNRWIEQEEPSSGKQMKEFFSSVKVMLLFRRLSGS